MKLALGSLLLVASSALAAPPAKPLLVVCSPGAPGTTEEAQPTMDAFASALSAKAGLPLTAAYEDSEEAGVARLRTEGAGVALVSLPFYLKHEQALGLRPRLQAAPKGRPGLERWTLVAKGGRVARPASLDGFTLVSSAGYAPAFVRGPALGSWGPLPPGVRVVQSSAVLSALRRAAAGEGVAVLLDGAQEAALPSLSFAAGLEVVARSPPLPAGVVAAVGDRLSAKAWKAVEEALLALPSEQAGAGALEAMQLTRFEPLDQGALASARKAYAEAAR